uniref:F-box domain-containing protein n=1 Tax=Strongyloides papillosus TaxID=174720 RepID=A0A0N5BC84_STREA
MDSGIAETQEIHEDGLESISDIELLPDEILTYIFSMNSLKDIVNIKKTCRKFYNLIEYNTHLMKKTPVHQVYISNYGRRGFNLVDLTVFYPGTNNSPHVFNRYRRLDIFDKEELCRCLKLFITDNFYGFYVHGFRDIEIFDTLNRCFNRGSSIRFISVHGLSYYDSGNFSTFIRNTKNTERLEIRSICTGSFGDRIFTNLDLSSMTTLKRVDFSECGSRRFLNDTFISNLYNNNPLLNDINISTKNEALLTRLSTAFMNSRNEDENPVCNHSSIELLLKTTEANGDFRSIIRAVFRNFQATRSLYSFEYSETNILIEAQKLCHTCLTNWINVFVVIVKDPDYYHHEG